MKFLCIIFASLLLAGPALANPADWRGVITRQIEAFRADDFATAFTYASPAIKGIFGTPEVFGQMVRQGYPMVHRPQSMRFLDAEELGGRQMQKLLITDAAGVSYLALYEMIETPEGWKINGVRILPAPDLGV